MSEVQRMTYREACRQAIRQALRDEPRPPGSEKLSGDEKYRIRQGAYRILYSIDDAAIVVEVVKVGHRRDVYR